MREITFFVPGICRPSGSKRFVGLAASGRARVIDANPQASGWKERIALAAHEAKQKAGLEGLLEGPLQMFATFYLPRPKHHRRANGELKPSAPNYPTGPPDVLKLARSAEDSMSGVLYRDDAQIASETLWKFYAGDLPENAPGVKIDLWELTNGK